MSEKGFVRETIEAKHQIIDEMPKSILHQCPGHIACACGWVSMACDKELGRQEHQKHVDEPVLIKGEPVVQATIIDNRIVLMTFEDMLTDI